MPRSDPELSPLKKTIKRAVETFISKRCPKKSVIVLLSGGADSTVVALAAHYLGKRVTAVSFRLEGHSSWDFDTARATAAKMKWRFEEVVVPTNEPKRYFKQLINEYGCKKKTEVEVLYPFLFILEKLKALKTDKVLTGFGSPLPDGRRESIDCQRNPRAYWENLLQVQYDSTATQRCIEVAAGMGIDVLQPLNQDAIKMALVGTTTKEVNSPYHKHHWKDLYRADFERLGLLKTGLTPSLQTGGSVETFFAALLDDPEIVGTNPLMGDVKRKLTTICRRWSSLKLPKVDRQTDRRSDGIVDIPFRPYTLADVYRSSARELFTVVSTFAGGGGSSTGYRLAGGKVIFANEFVEEAVKTYSLNYPDTPVISDDIRRFNHGKENVFRLFRSFGIEQGELDILDGSPPCSTFSKATLGKGKEKIDKKDVAYSDTRQNRVGMLIHDFVFMANAIQPKVCVIENVPEIAKSEVFHHAMERLRRHDYTISYKKLVATDYGVPQKRHRLFVLAVRPDIAKAAGITSSEDLKSVFPTRQRPVYSIRLALDGVDISPHERDMLLTMTRKGATYELVRALPKNPSKHTRISDVIPDWNTDFSLTRACWDLPSPTITATGAGGRGGIIHPEEDRLFSLQELKRLSGLPDDFKLSGQFAQKAERIGRMVPPLMTKAIATAVYEKILSKS